MRILSFKGFREEFYAAGLGTYFSPQGLRALYAIVYNPRNDEPEILWNTPGMLCWRYSELPRADADPCRILASVPGARVIVKD